MLKYILPVVGVMSSPNPAQTSLPSRSWTPFRRLLAVTIILTTIQGLIGGPLAGTGGFQIASNTSFSAVISAITASSGLLIFHAIEGVAILLLAIATTAYSFRYERGKVRLFAALGLVAALITITGGYLHMGGSIAGVALMGEGFILTSAFLFVTLYYTK